MFGPQCDLGAKCVFSGQPCVREIASFLRVEYWSVIGPAGISVSSLSFPIRVVHHSRVALCIRLMNVTLPCFHVFLLHMHA